MPVETLIDRQIDSYNDAMHILFELSEKYDLVPVESHKSLNMLSKPKTK